MLNVERSGSRLNGDALDFQARELPAMADGAVIAFPAAILERDDFLVLALLHDLACDGRPFDERTAMREIVAVAMKKNIGENGLPPGFTLEQIDIDNVALRDAMLSAACFDNCVSHGRRKSRAKSHAGELLTRGNHTRGKANVKNPPR